MEQKSEKEKPLIQRKHGKVVLIGMLCFAVIFYMACYIMFPHGSGKFLFVCGICLGGFAIPFVPAMLYDKYESRVMCVIAYGVLTIPIILALVFWVKMRIIADHNYVLPDASIIRFKTKVDWNLVRNDGVGEDWKKRIKIQTDLNDLNKSSSYHLASIGSDIVVIASVTEDDSYDDDEDRGYDLDFDESAHNQVIFPATVNFGEKQGVTVGITTEALNQNKDGTGDHGQAIWECNITIERVFDFWEVLTSKP